MELFDGGSDSENDAPPTIKVNEEYARRYEHNKNREDLHRYEDLKKRGLIDDDDSSDDSSSDDDEDEEIIQTVTSKEKEFFDVMIKVKNRDPILKNKEVQFFKDDDDDDDDDKDTKTKSKAKKPAYLKDVLAKNLLEDGAELPEDDDVVVDRSDVSKSYNEVQELNRRAVLEAAAAAAPKEEDDDDDDLLRPKESSDTVEDEADEELDKKLDEYFGQDLDENSKFLKEFFKNKMWLDKNQGKTAAEIKDEDLEMVSEDEMEIEKQEEYEYRFQENTGDRVLGHAREVEGSVRKKVNTRKEQRKRREERMEIAKLDREHELRHLKNLKKKENDDRIKKIMKIAGIKHGDDYLFDPKMLEDEFDPEEFDRTMKKVYNDKYYEDDDTEFCSDMDNDGEIEKPDFDKEDELLGLPKGWDGDGSADGFLAAREKILSLKENTGLLSEEEEEDREEDKEGEQNGKQIEEVKQEKKRKLAILERAKKEMLDEYYKLDYEDTIGDLKTRFRYTKTKPNRFGLTTAELLMLDEKELNEYVSLKKLAPYGDEWKVPNSKRNEVKKRTREISTQGKPDHKKHAKKSRVTDYSKDSSSSQPADVLGKEQVPDSIGEKPKLSRKARRKLNKSQREGEALAPSRLAAYGVLPPKTKIKGIIQI